MNGTQAKKVIGYAVLPGIVPQMKLLFASGFGYIAFLMGQIYNMVRLLPNGHPYLEPANIGKFGIRHVIAEAANNLELKKKNIDQMVIFVALLGGIIIMLLQIIILAYAYVIEPALAGSIFDTPDPAAGGNLTDISFIMLDNVFGVPDLFCNFAGTCTDVQATLPLPFHIALHSMFEFYSLGLLIIAVLIFLYFVVVVLVETTTTGTPFGQRFQNVWVPIRLVMALGLLVPINYGLNSSQYITLYAAKYGAGFATNGWNRFVNTIQEGASGVGVFPGGEGLNPTGEKESLIGKPKTPDISGPVQFMSIVHGCAYAYWKTDQNVAITNPFPPGQGARVQPYLVKQTFPWMNDQRTVLQVTPTTVDYTGALDFYDNSDIVIVFGHYDPADPEYDDYVGNVKPLCGSIRIKISSLKNRGEGLTGSPPVGGPDMIQNYYFDMIKNMWFNDIFLRTLGHRHIELTIGTRPPLQCLIGCANPNLPRCTLPPLLRGPCAAPFPASQPAAVAKQERVNFYQAQVQTIIDVAWDNYRRYGIDFVITDDIRDRGWGGAGIWYNTIAELNGSFIASVQNTPSVQNYPLVMEYVQVHKRENDSNISDLTQFMPNLSESQGAEIPGGEVGENIAHSLGEFYEYWNKDDANQANPDKSLTASIFESAINMIFGTEGLYSMRGENASIHPLAQLSSLGKGLVDSAIRNIAGGTAAAALGGPVRLLSNLAGAGLEAASNIMTSAAFIGLTAGFVLYYIVPFLPFIQFFFAVGGWVKGIFEAMVGAPLWALAHLRIDGDGLPGDSASNGYFLILEIFIRPILTVFGLVAAMVIFTAQVRLLNVIWGLVVDNLSGFDVGVLGAFEGEQEVPRNVIDQFFFTMIYAILVYMLATASFKLITAIPNNLLRWAGVGVSSFGDIAEDPTQGLVKYAGIGGLTIGQKIAPGLRGIGQAAGNQVAGLGGKLGEGTIPKRGGP